MALIPMTKSVKSDSVKMKILVVLIPAQILATIDLNLSELEYLSNHLRPEECRRLVAAAHFTSYNMPNSINQAEQAIPEDESCLQLLRHWNSAAGEGKGETHEALEHRLRQIGKNELADWLGRTVFHQLGEDLEKSLKDGLGDIANDTSSTSRNVPMPTLAPIIDYSDANKWEPFDSICLVLLTGLIIITCGLCCFAIFSKCLLKYKERRRKRKLGKPQYYEMVEDESEEEKFDIRQHETAM